MWYDWKLEDSLVKLLFLFLIRLTVELFVLKLNIRYSKVILP